VEKPIFNEKGVFDELRLVFVDTNYIKTNLPAETIMYLHVQKSSFDEVAFLSIVDRTKGLPVSSGISLFYFHKNQTSAFFGNNVDLTQSVSMVSFNYLITVAFKRLQCHFFSPLPFRSVTAAGTGVMFRISGRAGPTIGHSIL
jgi:hypothetical protein